MSSDIFPALFIIISTSFLLIIFLIFKRDHRLKKLKIPIIASALIILVIYFLNFNYLAIYDNSIDSIGFRIFPLLFMFFSILISISIYFSSKMEENDLVINSLNDKKSNIRNNNHKAEDPMFTEISNLLLKDFPKRIKEDIKPIEDFKNLLRNLQEFKNVKKDN